MYLEYMKKNFKKNLLIQIPVIIFLSLIVFLINRNFSINWVLARDVFIICIGEIIFLIFYNFIILNIFYEEDTICRFINNISKIFFYYFIVIMDIGYLLSLFAIINFCNCEALLSMFFIRNTFVFCCKKLNISAVVKKKDKDENEDEENSNN